MKRPPKIPKQLWSPLGPVKVLEVEQLKPENPEAPDDASDFGAFDHETRTIRVLRRLPPWAKWQALRHEWVHMVLFDSGFHNAFNEQEIEGFCDLIGTALAAEMRNGK